MLHKLGISYILKYSNLKFITSARLKTKIRGETLKKLKVSDQISSDIIH